MLLIYLPKKSSRCHYVLEYIFSEELGIDFETTNDKDAFENFEGEKLNYSEQRIDQAFFIKASGFLWQTEIMKQVIAVSEKESSIVLFPNTNDDLGFDIFSSVFYMLSRYEEYLPFEEDKFGRFSAKSSLAYQNNFLQKPVVNIWIARLKKVLKSQFEKLEFKNSNFTAILTYDVDVAFKYRGRSVGRNFGSALKDMLGFRVKNFKDRIQTLLQSQKDPWDIYGELKTLIGKNQIPSVFFFLLGDKSEHDRNLHYRHPVMKRLIHEVTTFSDIGIHPSFHTSSFPEKIGVEKQRLEALSGKKITKSRQHYLRFKLPDTCNALLSSGISEDYSMGFPDEPGFRAGTCKPFYFYDLRNEKATSLKIFPVTCMDATFIYYLEKSPEKSFMQILNLLKEVKKVDGTFIPIFHNDILGESAVWGSVHHKIMQQAKSYLKTV